MRGNSNKYSTLQNHFVHLTNYSVNRKSKNFVKNKDANCDNIGNKWSLSAFKRYMTSIGYQFDKIWERICDLIIKAIISAEGPINVASKMFVPYRGNCYELYGFDIILDDKLKPWLLEINLTPSLSCDSPLDHKVKCNLMADLFNLIGIRAYDRHALKEQQSEDVYNPLSINDHLSKKAKKRLQKSKALLASRLTKFTKEPLYCEIDFSNLSIESMLIIKETVDENLRKRQFIRLFPSEDCTKYFDFIEYNRNNSMIVNRLFKKQHSTNLIPKLQGITVPLRPSPIKNVSFVYKKIYSIKQLVSGDLSNNAEISDNEGLETTNNLTLQQTEQPKNESNGITDISRVI